RRNHSAIIMPCKMTLANHAGVVLKGSPPRPTTMATWLKTPAASKEAKEYSLGPGFTCSTARYRRRHSLVHVGSATTVVSLSISGRGNARGGSKNPSGKMLISQSSGGPTQHRDRRSGKVQ